jgi:hypothetical protein
MIVERFIAIVPAYVDCHLVKFMRCNRRVISTSTLNSCEQSHSAISCNFIDCTHRNHIQLYHAISLIVLPQESHSAISCNFIDCTGEIESKKGVIIGDGNRLGMQIDMMKYLI